MVADAATPAPLIAGHGEPLLGDHHRIRLYALDHTVYETVAALQRVQGAVEEVGAPSRG